MGESFGRYRLADDESFMPFIDACNIACGFHAGDPVVIDRTIQKALKYNLEIGAHPSYPDLQGFGRRRMEVGENELEPILRYQIGAIRAMTQSNGGHLNHVKPHGALYNYAAIHMSTAMAIVKAVKNISPELILYVPPNSCLAEAAQQMGIKVMKEGFIDRTYDDEGKLVSRKLENAVITDPGIAQEQLEQMEKTGTVTTITNKEIPMIVETYCIHGDNPSALRILETLRRV